MTAIVLAHIAQDVYVPPPLWEGITSFWEAPNGDIWNLLDGSSGIALCPGTRGWDNPEYDEFTEAMPGLDGVTFQGVRAKPREVLWALAMYHPGSPTEILELDSMFWDTMDPEAFGWWHVVGPQGARRRLQIRFRQDTGEGWEFLPGTTEWLKYGIYLEATLQPYWQGDPISVVFDRETDSDFFGADDAPDFNIASSNSEARATITNPGKKEAWPVWRFDGYTEAGAEVGAVGRTTRIPIAVPEGRTLIIDTNPRVNTALLGTWNNTTGQLQNATNVMRQFGVTDFAPIPHGRDVPLTIRSSGSGSTRASITPLYRRAW